MSQQQKQLSYIRSSPNLKLFYDRLSSHLSKLNLNPKGNSVNPITLSGYKFAKTISVTASASVPTYKPEFMEEVARSVTLRYVVPLSRVMPVQNKERTMEILADWAFSYIIDFLASELKKDNQTKLEVSSVVDSVFKANMFETKDLPLTVRFVSTAEASDVPKILLPTSSENDGNQAGVFSRCGIVTMDGEIYAKGKAPSSEESKEIVTDAVVPPELTKSEATTVTRKNSGLSSVWKSEPKPAPVCDEPERFGYRLGTKEEATNLALTQTIISEEDRNQIVEYFGKVMSTGAYTSLDEEVSRMGEELKLYATLREEFEEFKRMHQPVVVAEN